MNLTQNYTPHTSGNTGLEYQHFIVFTPTNTSSYDFIFTHFIFDTKFLSCIDHLTSGGSRGGQGPK